MSDADTSGYCVVCGEYGRGRYAYPIEDRAEAITDHVGCAVDRSYSSRKNRQSGTPRASATTR